MERKQIVKSQKERERVENEVRETKVEGVKSIEVDFIRTKKKNEE